MLHSLLSWFSRDFSRFWTKISEIQRKSPGFFEKLSNFCSKIFFLHLGVSYGAANFLGFQGIFIVLGLKFFQIQKNCLDSKKIEFSQFKKKNFFPHLLFFSSNSRRCMHTTTVGGHVIEEGCHVQIDTWSMHYNPEIWGDDVAEFKPER